MLKSAPSYSEHDVTNTLLGMESLLHSFLVSKLEELELSPSSFFWTREIFACFPLDRKLDGKHNRSIQFG